MNIHSNIQLTIFSSEASSWLLHVVWVGFWHLLGFPFGSAGKESACNAGDMGLILGLGRSSGEGKGYPFQYSGLENSGDFIVHGVAKSQTQLSDFHFTWHLLLRNGIYRVQWIWFSTFSSIHYNYNYSKWENWDLEMFFKYPRWIRILFQNFRPQLMFLFFCFSIVSEIANKAGPAIDAFYHLIYLFTFLYYH